MRKQWCAIEGCERSVKSRGWCRMHYKRWLAHGDPTTRLPTGHAARWSSLEERFWAKVDRSGGPDGCWLWMAGIDRLGYGRFTQNGKLRLAHVVAYELTIGPVPIGLELDHVRDRGCLHKHCVNPAHLEAVTHGENVRRGWVVRHANAESRVS